MKPLIIAILLSVLFNCCSTNREFVSHEDLTKNKENAIEKIDYLLRSYDYYERFSGSVLIAYEDSILYQNSFGFSNYEKNQKNSETSIYGIASCSKQFTAMAILKLIQKGEISLEDKLSKFYPELGEFSKKISIENLLTHSSGISKDIGRGDNWDEILFPQATPISLDSLIHIFGKLTLDFTPGNKFEYNNHNYVLLAGIIEKMTDTVYRTFLKKTFFDSLQLNSTDFNQSNISEFNLSKPYNGLPLTYNTPPFWDDSWAIGAGGMYSSVNDLYVWIKILKNKKLLSTELTDAMFEPHQPDGKEHYGYGWQIAEKFGNKYIYHDGGTNGYYCKMGFIPSQDLYVIILSNHTHNLKELDRTSRLIEKLNDQIMNIMFGKQYEKLPIPDSITKTNFNNKVIINRQSFLISTPENENIIIQSEGDYSVFDLPYSAAMVEKNVRFKIVEKVVKAYGEHDFKTILDNSSLLLWLLVSEDKLAEIWKELAGETGPLKSWNCYQLPNKERQNDYYIRMVFERKEMGLQLVFKGNKINGMFTDKTFSYNGPKSVECISLGNNNYFLDGFKYGYPDGYIFKDGTDYYLNILNQSLKMTIID